MIGVTPCSLGAAAREALGLADLPEAMLHGLGEALERGDHRRHATVPTRSGVSAYDLIGRSRYRLRKHIVEPVFGQTKAAQVSAGARAQKRPRSAWPMFPARC